MSSNIPSFLRSDYTNKDPISLWDARGNYGGGQYVNVEIYSDNNYVENEKDIDSILNMNTYKCHICNINVPKPYIEEHLQSAKHEMFLKITNIALERTQLHMKTDHLYTKRKIEVTDTYFCEHCTTIVQNENKNEHILSNDHLNAVKNDGLLRKLVQIYEEPTKDCDSNILSVKDIKMQKLVNALELTEVGIKRGREDESERAEENNSAKETVDIRVNEADVTKDREARSEHKSNPHLSEEITAKQSQININKSIIQNHNDNRNSNETKVKPQEFNDDQEKKPIKNNETSKEKLEEPCATDKSSKIEIKQNANPITSKTENEPTPKPSTSKTENEPISKPSTFKTKNEPTAKPSSSKTENEPISKPSTFKTKNEPTAKPSTSKTENEPTPKPSTSKTENEPTSKPSTFKTKNEPTAKPSTSKTENEPTPKPSTSKTENEPTSKPSTFKTKNEPTAKPSTSKTENEPNAKPSTSKTEPESNAKQNTTHTEKVAPYSETLDDIKVFLEIASFLNTNAVEVTAHSEDSVHISASNVEKVKIPLQNFHGFTVTGQDVVCKICGDMKSVDGKKHKWNNVHMKNIMSPLKKGYYRQVNDILNHCILCNSLHSPSQIAAHVDSKEHSRNLEKYTASKYNISTRYAHLAVTNCMRWTHNKIYCKICEIQLPKTNDSINAHIQSSVHTKKHALLLSVNKIVKVPNERGYYDCSVCVKTIWAGQLLQHCKYSQHVKRIATLG